MQNSPYGGAYPDAFSILSGNNCNQSFLKAISFTKESYARTLWFSETAKSKIPNYGIIGHESVPKKLTSVETMKARSEGGFGNEGNVVGGINLFYTPNEFFSWRNEALLSMFHANYLDIDTASHKSISSAQSKAILDDVLTQLKANNIPSPNAIVASGSGGWHLYWLYSPVDAKPHNKFIWRNIAQKLISSVKSKKSFTVDAGASKNSAGLFRLPGSFHLNAQTQCDCVFLDELYDFELLSRSLDIALTPPTPKKTKTKHVQTGNPRHKFKDYYANVYFNLLEVANSGKIKKGTVFKGVKYNGNRDMFLFMAMVCLRQIKHSAEDAYNEVLKLNKRYGLFVGNGPDSSPELVEKYLQPCFKTKFNYSKVSIIQIFSHHFKTDIEHIFDQPKVGISKEEVAQRQKQAALRTHQMRQEKTKSLITRALKSLHKKGLKPTYQAVSDIIGMSLRTVKYYRDFYTSKVSAIWSACSYTPPRGIFNLESFKKVKPLNWFALFVMTDPAPAFYPVSTFFNEVLEPPSLLYDTG